MFGVTHIGDEEDETAGEENGSACHGKRQKEASRVVHEGSDHRPDCEAKVERGVAPGLHNVVWLGGGTCPEPLIFNYLTKSPLRWPFCPGTWPSRWRGWRSMLLLLPLPSKQFCTHLEGKLLFLAENSPFWWVNLTFLSVSSIFVGKYLILIFFSRNMFVCFDPTLFPTVASVDKMQQGSFQRSVLIGKRANVRWIITQNVSCEDIFNSTSR